MKDDPRRRREGPRQDGEEIEILEVVGLSDEAPPPSDRDPEEVEVDFDHGAAAPAPPRAPAPAEAPEEETLRERLLRLQADFENFKKRIERERADYYRHATATLVRKLLPVLDNLERALTASAGTNNDAALRQGLVLIHRQFLAELRGEGLEPMEAVGAPFDPLHHEAVATDPSSEAPPNTVVAEIQRGYFFKDRVLRPAAVRVSVEPSGTAAPAGDREET